MDQFPRTMEVPAIQTTAIIVVHYDDQEIFKGVANQKVTRGDTMNSSTVAQKLIQKSRKRFE